MKKLYFAFALALLMVSCGGEQTTNTETPTDSLTNSVDTGSINVNKEEISMILEAIPNPLETSLLIKDLGVDYNKAMLSNPEEVDKYTTSFKQAFNLGIYSTDLGYANLYERNQDVLDFLNPVKKLAQDLSIDKHLNYEEIKKLTQNSNNLEQLLTETQKNLAAINTDLRDQGRENLSILILTGGWLEAMYISATVYDKKPDVKLKERIGEQKEVLGMIIKAAKNYQNKPNFSELVTDLEDLNKAYDAVQIIVEQNKNENTGMQVDKNGELVITSPNTTRIEISDADLKTITGKIKAIRTKNVKP